jgi:predicted RecB family nuclease
MEGQMPEKINRQVLDSYFACKFKTHLMLSGEQGVPSEYLKMTCEQDRLFKTAVQQNVTRAEATQKQVVLTKSLLGAGYPLILDGTFDDERFNLEFDGIMKMDGPSAIGPFHYAPVLFYDGETIRQPQKQLLGVYAVVLEALQNRMPTVGIVYNRGHTERRVRLSPDASTMLNVLKDLKGMQDGGTPELRLNDHCQICEFRQGCHAQALKEDNISLLRGISDTEITRIRSKGIFTVKQLSYTFRSRRIPKRTKVPSTPHHFALQALAIREQKVFVHGNPILHCPGTRAYLDIEGTPDTRSYYLIGLMTVAANDTATYHHFWADNETSEVNIFIDLFDQLDREGTQSLIHFGNYEIKALRAIRKKLPPSYQAKVDEALTSSVNILSVIHPHVYFPTYSNSLKDIARYLNFEWSDPSSSGLQSLVWRWRWLHSEPFYKDKLLQYNRDDCAALRIVTEFVETIISPDTRNVAPAGAQCIHTGTLVKDKDQRALFGKKDFALEDFSKINECAYFDYQHDRIFARDRGHRPHRAGQMQRTRDLSRRINKIMQIRRSNCPHCGARKLLKMKAVSRRIIDLKISQSGIKRWITRYDAHVYRCNRCKAFFKPAGYPRGSRYGGTLIAWCIYQNVRYGINLSQICSIVGETFGIPLRVQVMYRFKAVVARHYAAQYELILSEIVMGRALYVDETPVNLWKSKGYVWVFAAVNAVYFFYKDSREG